MRCAIYTRKSTEEGLEQDFNSLQAQREACEAYIKSQKHEGWQLVKAHYDDGGFSGGKNCRKNCPLGSLVMMRFMGIYLGNDTVEIRSRMKK